MSDCDWCGADIESKWFDAGASAGSYECPACGAELNAITTDNGWQSSVRFKLVKAPPDLDDDDCPNCGGEGWVEDESDPVNDALCDPETGATVYPLAPCETCNPHGRRIEADEQLEDAGFASPEVDKTRAALRALDALEEERDRLRAEVASLWGLLREARGYVPDTYEPVSGLARRIDAALSLRGEESK